MNSIWDLIKDWVILFLLITLSAVAIFAQNEPLVQSLRAGALDMSASIESGFAWVGGFYRALDENQLLRDENIDLSTEVARSREALAENLRLRRMLNFRDTTDLPLEPARIVSKDITRQRNLFSIDAGENDGVEPGMAVITDQGILGKVILVSRNYARVMPYLNTDFRMPAKIQPLRADGIISWEGDRSDQLLMEHVSRTEPALRGQRIVTSGYSGIFPSGLSVGYIDSLAARPGRNEYRVFVRPSSLYQRADHVFVVLERPDQELEALNDEDIR